MLLPLLARGQSGFPRSPPFDHNASLSIMAGGRQAGFCKEADLRVKVLRTNTGMGTNTADLVETDDGRVGYLIQQPPQDALEDDELFNLLQGQFPWGEEGEVFELPAGVKVIFDPSELPDEDFTIYCPDCEQEFVGRRMYGGRYPRCPRCEPDE
jgi:hypothetical protein